MNKMERKFGRYAIPNLMYYIVILYAVGVLVQMMAPAFYIQYLMLDARAILHGQIWRVVTFMIWPPSGSLFFNLIAIYLYYNLGMTLERVWGTFRFNVYFFMGVIGHVLAALLIYIITGQVYILTTDYLNFSLFFAFAATFPEMQFYLFFVLPIKAKYLALFDGLYFVYGFLFGGMSQRIAIVMSLLNFIVYLFMSRGSRLNPKGNSEENRSFTHRCARRRRQRKRSDATAVLFADVRRRMTRILYSATAPSAKATMNTVRTTCIPTNM